MGYRLSLLAGVGLGAGFAYLADPDNGKHRRAVARDRALHLARRAAHFGSATLRGYANRARGVVAEARARMTEEHPTDELLAERVRSRIGHLVGQPAAVEVEVSDGRVTLSGYVPAQELTRLIAGVQRVRGVNLVEHRLEVYELAGVAPERDGSVDDFV